MTAPESARPSRSRQPPLRGFPAPSRLDPLWLLLSLLAVWASIGPWGLALAGWLAPLLTLRFLRARRGWRGYSVAWAATAVVVALALRGVVPIPGVGYLAFVAVSVLLAFAPYLVDRWLLPWLPLWAGVLAFPAAVTLLEFFNAQGPYGSFGSSAYTQAGWLPVVQLAALGGIWAIVFLMHWAASAGATMWAEVGRGARPATLPGVWLPAALALVAAVGWGGARLALAPAPGEPAAETRTVAMLTSDNSLISDAAGGDAELARVFDRVMNAAPEDAALRAELIAAFDASNARLLERTAAAAAGGADLVLWAEGNAMALPESEAELVAAARGLADREGIVIGVALATLTPGAERPLENQLIVVGPANAGDAYLKAFPVPGPEAAASVAGAEAPLLVDTALGRVAGVICFDADFPAFVAGAGRAGAELLLVPANDWAEVRRIHADMAVFRAVENGVPLVRAASDGVSLAADAWGRVAAERDDFAPAAASLVTALPTARAATLYPRLGDAVAVASLALLVALTLGASGAGVARRIRRRRERSAPTTA